MSRRPVLIPSIEIALALRRRPKPPMVLCTWDNIWREVQPLKEQGLWARIRRIFR